MTNETQTRKDETMSNPEAYAKDRIEAMIHDLVTCLTKDTLHALVYDIETRAALPKREDIKTLLARLDTQISVLG